MSVEQSFIAKLPTLQVVKRSTDTLSCSLMVKKASLCVNESKMEEVFSSLGCYDRLTVLEMFSIHQYMHHHT